VTDCTARHDPNVVHNIKRRACKRRRRLMAGLAGLRRRHVRSRLAPRRRPVMARRAPAHDSRVVERGSQERRRRLMAGLAGLRRRHVRSRLAPRCRPVMARRTPRRDPRVVISIGHKLPIRRTHAMAGIARSSCSQVPGRLPLSLDTVVTSCTSTWTNSRMFEGCASPTNRPMATVTVHSRQNMTRRLAYGTWSRFPERHRYG
jgi:hypothetical protein